MVNFSFKLKNEDAENVIEIIQEKITERIWNEFAKPSKLDDEVISSKFDGVLHFKNGEGIEYLRICYTTIEDDTEKYVVEELNVELIKSNLLDLIPSSTSVPLYPWGEKRNYDSHNNEIVLGIVNGPLAKGVGIYTYHFTPDYGEEFPNSECEKLVNLFAQKGWILSYENLSTEGTIKFWISRNPTHDSKE